MAHRAHVVLGDDLVAEIDRLVGSRKRSQFIADAAMRELLRRRQLSALDRAAGAWKHDDNPDSRGDSRTIRAIRRHNERRLARLRRA